MSTLLADARREAGLTLVQLAELAGTSHPALSAYERGRKQPQLSTLERILEAMGFELSYAPAHTYEWHHPLRGRPFVVPTSLPRLPVSRALAVVELPSAVDWSEPRRPYDLSKRHDRALAYETVLRQGGPEDIDTYVDGALLVDIWDELHLPKVLRSAWTPIIEESRLPQTQYHHKVEAK